MSYMNRENIIEEGFFDKIKKAFTKQKKDKKTKEIYSKDKKIQKAYEDAADAAQDALDNAERLAKLYNLPPLKY